MPSNANVYIEYGPYNSNGIVEYSLDRLVGLQKYLVSKGHKIIELKRAKNWNNLELIVNEQRIFKCKLNDLDFGGDGELDDLVIKAEESVRNAY